MYVKVVYEDQTITWDVGNKARFKFGKNGVDGMILGGEPGEIETVQFYRNGDIFLLDNDGKTIDRHKSSGEDMMTGEWGDFGVTAS